MGEAKKFGIGWGIPHRMAADDAKGVIELRLLFYVRLIGLSIGQCARPNLVIDLALATIKTRKFVFVYLFFVFRNNTGGTVANTNVA